MKKSVRIISIAAAAAMTFSMSAISTSAYCGLTAADLAQAKAQSNYSNYYSNYNNYNYTQSCPTTTQSCPTTTQSCPTTTQSYPTTTQSCPTTTQSCPTTTQDCPTTTPQTETTTQTNPTYEQKTSIDLNSILSGLFNSLFGGNNTDNSTASSQEQPTVPQTPSVTQPVVSTPDTDCTTENCDPVPCAPTTPTVPTTPAQPTTPTQPTTPIAPTTPVQPTTPTQPTTPAQPTTPSVPSSTCGDYASDMLVMINNARAEVGAPALKLSSELCNAANIRAKEIDTSFSHTRPDGNSFYSVLDDINYSGSRSCGENIAAGNDTVSETFEQWMNSQGHYENMMNANYKYIGIGYYKTNSGYKYYWTQIFSR